MSTCDVFNCLFLPDVRNEIQLLSRVFCYSWLVCPLGFWLRNTSPVKDGNPISGGIDSFSFFTLLDWKVWSDVASRSCLSNYCICVCFFHISTFMKPSAVTHVWIKIWDNDLTYSMRFDSSLQNFKNALVDIFSPQIERKKRCVFILAVERKLWAIFSPRVHLWKQQTPGSRLQNINLGFKHKDSGFVFVNENCCLCKCFTELYFFYWLLVVSLAICR